VTLRHAGAPTDPLKLSPTNEEIIQVGHLVMAGLFLYRAAAVFLMKTSISGCDKNITSSADPIGIAKIALANPKFDD
jgi:hypothetical protein